MNKSKVIRNFFYTNKFFVFSVCLSFLFALLLIPQIQSLVIFVGNKLLGKSIELNLVWRNRFTEHSLKCIAIFLSLGAVVQFFKFKNENNFDNQESLKTVKHINFFFFGFFLICAFFILSICSTCSFLYPFHTWDDANCFFTVGKSVWNGKIIYKDLFDQKGPLIYFIHSAAYLISHKNFTGIFFFEIISSSFFMFFCWKMLMLFSGKFCAFLVPLIAALAYSSTSFVLGDSAEEFCLPFFMYQLYISVKNLKNGTLFKKSEFLLTGIFAGCVLWIKFSLLGFYIGWCIVPIFLYAKQKRIKKIAIAFCLVFLGIFLATLPYLIYFGLNHAIKDWFEVYIYDNIFLYTKKENDFVALALAKALFRFYWRNYFYLFATLVSFVALLKICYKKQKSIIIHFLSIYFVMILFIYGGGRWYEYYGFDLILFASFSVLPLYELLKNIFKNCQIFNSKRGKLFLPFVFMIIAFSTAFLLTKNKEILRLKKDDLPQFKFDKIISQKSNPTLLNYGMLDLGFYTASGIFPVNRFFADSNMPLQEIADEQNEIVKTGAVDFVVSRVPIDSEKYELISTASSNIRNHKKTFYLYKNKSFDF